ncbi:hypothetical protein WA026_005884 [Henosepilachna vigintioctopunctata]|uniref:Uncharacterized protein n=1 Tax=Henosepilachna vigintioctopunctata TaxID=420089 RepID=A0AAW1TWF8_9CUCU
MRRLSVVTPQSEEFKLFSVKLSVLTFTYIIFYMSIIALGAVFFHDCPASPYIPLYLIVQGSIGIISRATKPLQYLSMVGKYTCIVWTIIVIVRLIELIVFGFGSMWVYKAYPPNYLDKNNPEYCHKGLYLFTFCYISVAFICLFLFLVLICCSVCVSILYDFPMTESSLYRFLWYN